MNRLVHTTGASQGYARLCSILRCRQGDRAWQLDGERDAVWQKDRHAIAKRLAHQAADLPQVRRYGDRIHLSIRDIWGRAMEFRDVRGTNDEGQAGCISSRPKHAILASLRVPFADHEETTK